jgi:hypothetical protein
VVVPQVKKNYRATGDHPTLENSILLFAASKPSLARFSTCCSGSRDYIEGVLKQASQEVSSYIGYAQHWGESLQTVEIGGLSLAVKDVE